jgi:hypothetical protein
LTWRRSGEEQLLWRFKKKGIDFHIELERNDVRHDEFFFFGINSDNLEKLKSEMEGTNTRKKRTQYEIPAVAIKSKWWDVGITSGDLITVKKANFKGANFIIISILYSSNENFSLLLMEEQQFNDFELDMKVNQKKTSTLTEHCIFNC